jgi:diguanylate cyclase (GGDEF)-like protein
MRSGLDGHNSPPRTVQGSRAPDWAELPVAPRAYVVTLSALGFLVVAMSLAAVDQGGYALLALLIVLSIPVSLMKVSLPGTASSLSMAHVIGYLTLLTLGARAAVLVTAAGAWSQCTFRTHQRNQVYQTLFSIATLALAMRAAGTAYLVLGGTLGGWEASTALVPLLAAATMFFVLNTILVSGAIGLTTGRPVGRLWVETYLPTWPAFLLGIAVAVASAFALRGAGLWLVLFLAVPFVVAFHNLRTYLERLDEAVTDALTGLPNQRFVLAHAARELTLARRHGTGMTIVAADLDGFKPLNDRYGHAAGDLALRQVAARMRALLRLHDVCARHGGDEFLAVLSGCGAAEGHARAVELQTAIEMLQIEIRPAVLARVGISIGTATYPDDGDSLERLLEVADARMYTNKLQRASPDARAPAAEAASPR